MGSYTSIEFLPTIFMVGLLDTLRHYAILLEQQCGLGPGEEIDSSHYVEDTYFVWKFQDCSIKLFWSDEDQSSEWLWISIECKNASAKNLVDKILAGLQPYFSDSRVV